MPRLPRGYKNLVIDTVYLSSCLSRLESRFLNCGLIIIGDFNKLNIFRLTYNYNMHQLVNFPIRGSNTLYLVLTNLYDFYLQPGKYAGFFSSLIIIMCVILNPKVCSLLPKVQKTVIMKRNFINIIIILYFMRITLLPRGILPNGPQYLLSTS